MKKNINRIKKPYAFCSILSIHDYYYLFTYVFYFNFYRSHSILYFTQSCSFTYIYFNSYTNQKYKN